MLGKQSSMLFNTLVRTLTQASRHPPGPEVHRDPGLIQEDCGDLRQSGLCLAWQKEDLHELRFANQFSVSFPLPVQKEGFNLCQD